MQYLVMFKRLDKTVKVINTGSYKNDALDEMWYRKEQEKSIERLELWCETGLQCYRELNVSYEQEN